MSGKAWPAAGSESCVVAERFALRSVDSGCAGRAIEPRKNRFAGADAVLKADGRYLRAVDGSPIFDGFSRRFSTGIVAWREGPAGV